MRSLPNEIAANSYDSKRFRDFLSACNRVAHDKDLVQCMAAIYAIESYFRPTMFRVGEYCIVILSGLASIFLGTPLKNYTIGVCQLGLATICNYYGANYYQHQAQIRFKSLKNLFDVLSVISQAQSARILLYRLSPMLIRAQNIYPKDTDQQLCYIGEQFNGRFSYGLMLCEVRKELNILNLKRTLL